MGHKYRNIIKYQLLIDKTANEKLKQYVLHQFIAAVRTAPTATEDILLDFLTFFPDMDFFKSTKQLENN